jgi:hypothetical protein
MPHLAIPRSTASRLLMLPMLCVLTLSALPSQAFNDWDPYFPPEVTMPHVRTRMRLTFLLPTPQLPPEANLLAAPADDEQPAGGAHHHARGDVMTWQIPIAANIPAVTPAATRGQSQRQGITHVVRQINQSAGASSRITVPDDQPVAALQTVTQPEPPPILLNTPRAVRPVVHPLPLLTPNDSDFERPLRQ